MRVAPWNPSSTLQILRSPAGGDNTLARRLTEAVRLHRQSLRELALAKNLDLDTALGDQAALEENCRVDRGARVELLLELLEVHDRENTPVGAAKPPLR